MRKHCICTGKLLFYSPFIKKTTFVSHIIREIFFASIDQAACSLAGQYSAAHWKKVLQKQDVALLLHRNGQSFGIILEMIGQSSSLNLEQSPHTATVLTFDH